MMLNMTFLLVLIFIVRAEDRHLGSVQKNETVLYQGPKRPITAGTPLANLAPVKAEARNKSLARQDKYCRTEQTPTTPLFCKHALRSSWNAKSAVPWNRFMKRISM